MNKKTTKILPLGLLLLVKNYFSSCSFHNTSLVHSSSGTVPALQRPTNLQQLISDNLE